MATATCYEKAVALLARRAHFRLELERKLEKREYAREEIELVLARLTEAGHLDDRATAEHYVTGRLRRGGIGPRRLLAELRQRGVDEGAAREVIDEQVEDEAELARAAAERWRRGRSARNTTPASLARHLERAGFASSLVAEHVRELRASLAEAENEEGPGFGF